MDKEEKEREAATNGSRLRQVHKGGNARQGGLSFRKGWQVLQLSLLEDIYKCTTRHGGEYVGDEIN